MLALRAERDIVDIVLIKLHSLEIRAELDVVAILEAYLACPVCPGVVKPGQTDASDPQGPPLYIVGKKGPLRWLPTLPIPSLWQWFWGE